MKYRSRNNKSIFSRWRKQLSPGNENVMSEMTYAFEVIEACRFMSTGDLQQDAFEAAWRIKRLYKAIQEMPRGQRVALQERVDDVRVDGIRCL